MPKSFCSTETEMNRKILGMCIFNVTLSHLRSKKTESMYNTYSTPKTGVSNQCNGIWTGMWNGMVEWNDVTNPSVMQ